MKKEKHKWVKRKEIINMMGDAKYHYIIEYWACSECTARKYDA